jgi:low temperature requirement protein LtrA
MGVSVRWRSLSFKRTHLAERLGLLTLIILGEGVIVLTKSLNYLVGEDGWTTGTFGQAFVVVFTIVSLHFLRHLQAPSDSRLHPLLVPPVGPLL